MADLVVSDVLTYDLHIVDSFSSEREGLGGDAEQVC